MHWFDIGIIVLLAFAAFQGFRKGIIVEVAGLAALIFGIYGGIHLSDNMAQFLQRDFEIQSEYLPVIALALSIIFCMALIFITGRLVEKFFNAIALKGINKLLGAVFGVLKSAIVISLIVFLINGFSITVNLLPKNLSEESKFYTPLNDFSTWLIPTIKESSIYNSMVNEAQETLDQL